MNLGKQIKNARKVKGLTQKQLAELIGVAVITIQQYEGDKRTPQVEQLQNIAVALDTDVVYLLNGITAAEFAKRAENRTAKEVEDWVVKEYTDSEESRLITQGEELADRAYLEATESLTEQQLEQLLMNEYKNLNRLGRLKARECLAALTENPRYHAKKGDTNAEKD